MDEIENPLPSKTPPKKPSFFKRFWWVFVILGIGVIILVLTAISGARYDRNRENGGKGLFGLGNDEKEYNERIVKTFLPESGAAFKYNSPMLHEDYLYLGTSSRTGYDNVPIADLPDNFFYKLDLDFNVIWQYSLGKRMVTGGAVMDSNENIYFVAEQVTKNSDYAMGENEKMDKENEYLAAVNLVSLDSTGKFRWEKPISGENETWNRSMFSPAISADDIIYVGHERFYSFDAAGNLLAQYPEDDKKIKGFAGAPVIDSAGNVYFTATEPVVLSQNFNTEVIKAYKFSPKLTSLIWSTEMGNETMSQADPNISARKSYGVESTPALGIGEESLYGVTGCTISKIDTATGKLLWAIKPEGIIGYISASPAVDAEDNVYVGSKSNEYSKFFAVKSDGTLLWQTFIGADLYSSPILGDDNTVYFGSETLENGKFHALDRTTGMIKWEIAKNSEKTVPDFSLGSGLLYQGYIYIGVHTGVDENDKSIRNQTLYKIKVDANDYLPNAAWPRIHGGNDNSGRAK